MPFEGDKRQKVLVLLTMCFALFMAMLDNTVVNVSLPRIRLELGAGLSDLQWIVDGYVLAFASLLLTGGILGDRYGRKKTFLGGLVVFTVASLGCGLAGSSGQLILFRALQGVGAALLMPGTLSIITVTFPPHERAKAIGMWAGVSGLALALGPTLGGWMVEHLGWESVFFLNVPIGAVGLVVASRVVRESISEQTRHLDLVGLALGTGALFSVTYGLIESNEKGWSDPLIVSALAVSAVLLLAFLAWERRSPQAMMPLSFFRIPAFSAGNTVAFAVSFGMFGIFFFMSLYMQVIRGYSPFQAGVRFLPMTLMIVVTAPNAGRFASRHGSRLPMTYGLALTGIGLFLMSRVTETTPYALLLPLFVVMGHGMASTMSPMTAAVMNAVGHERAGLGSAMTNTSREVGGVFGIALLGTLLTARLKSSLVAGISGLGLAPSIARAIGETAGHGQIDPVLIAALDPARAAAVRGAFVAAFLDGFHLALLVASAVLLLGAAVAFTWIPSGAPQREVAHIGREEPVEV